ncbi:phenylacetate--CoA ligase family protein [Lentzea californiensis]|uniref:phenylacetate--CoA ligase family protein n=1 Tax=Lentzea californiensis TaxID=438851 RepID=UPI0021648EA8|nr:AMP-binding protein [Lentzea californiensis]MCR3747833.1 Phenylacetate-coenzyme A ligase PaaK, adenylate-forming domain family [Lentzea californiensis]
MNLEYELFAHAIGGASAVRLARDLDVISREELEELRDHNLAAMVRAVRETPAVSRRWPSLADGAGVAGIAALPLLTPAELAERCPPHSDDFLLRGGLPGMVLRSSGTSGRNKVVYHSWESNEVVDLLGARGVRAVLGKTPERIANCLFPAELNGAFIFVHDLSKHLPTLTFPLGSTMPFHEITAAIGDHGIDTLVAGPAFATELITTTPADQLRSLENLLYLGEAMGRARLDAVHAVLPGLNVRSLAYSTTETGPIGYQCAHLSGATHHVHEDAVLVEIVDSETGEHVPAGQAGEIVVTPLADTGMALLRYRIGDRGYFTTEPCGCGSPARLLTLLGRTAQSMNVDNWTISSDQLIGALEVLGITDAEDVQLQFLWESSKYEVRLLLSPRTPQGLSTELVREHLLPAYQLRKVLISPRCAGFSVERAELAEFERSARGKVPVLFQRI